MLEYFPSLLFVESRRADGRAAGWRADRDRRRVPSAAAARRAARREERSRPRRPRGSTPGRRSPNASSALPRATRPRATAGRPVGSIGAPASTGSPPSAWRATSRRRSSRSTRDERAASRKSVTLRDEPIEFVAIPYEGTTLPALLYRAPHPAPRPAMIHFDGFDVTKEWMHLCGIAREFARRGISTLMVDHPGVGAALRLQGLPMNPDSERWARAAMDWLEQRSDIDARRVGVIAMSLGGYYAPRAAAFEPRLACCVAWGARWDNDGSHGRMLRDAGRRALGDGLARPRALVLRRRRTRRGRGEDRANDARRRQSSASRVRCWSCTARTTARCRSSRPSARYARRRNSRARRIARVRCRRRRRRALQRRPVLDGDRRDDRLGRRRAAAVCAERRTRIVDYVAPATLDEAYQRARGATTRICLAGGQSLVAMMNLGLATPGRLVSLRRHRRSCAASTTDAGRRACASAR